MKRIIFFLTLGLVLASCEKKQDVTQTQPSSEYRIAGTMSVQAGKEPFVAQDTMLVVVDAENQTLIIGMQKVQFTERMPKMDIYTEDVSYEQVGQLLVVEQDTVIMTWGPERVPYADCPVAHLKDTIDLQAKTMRFTCTFAHKQFGDMPAAFSGSFVE